MLSFARRTASTHSGAAVGAAAALVEVAASDPEACL
jgi:hypothetical protein